MTETDARLTVTIARGNQNRQLQSRLPTDATAAAIGMATNIDMTHIGRTDDLREHPTQKFY